jgi:hypothetical protein
MDQDGSVEIDDLSKELNGGKNRNNPNVAINRNPNNPNVAINRNPNNPNVAINRNPPEGNRVPFDISSAQNYEQRIRLANQRKIEEEQSKIVEKIYEERMKREQELQAAKTEAKIKLRDESASSVIIQTDIIVAIVKRYDKLVDEIDNRLKMIGYSSSDKTFKLCKGFLQQELKAALDYRDFDRATDSGIVINENVIISKESLTELRLPTALQEYKYQYKIQSKSLTLRELVNGYLSNMYLIIESLRDNTFPKCLQFVILKKMIYDVTTNMPNMEYSDLEQRTRKYLASQIEGIKGTDIEEESLEIPSFKKQLTDLHPITRAKAYLDSSYDLDKVLKLSDEFETDLKNLHDEVGNTYESASKDFIEYLKSQTSIENIQYDNKTRVINGYIETNKKPETTPPPPIAIKDFVKSNKNVKNPPKGGDPKQIQQDVINIYSGFIKNTVLPQRDTIHETFKKELTDFVDSGISQVEMPKIEIPKCDDETQNYDIPISGSKGAEITVNTEFMDIRNKFIKGLEQLNNSFEKETNLIMSDKTLNDATRKKIQLGLYIIVKTTLQEEVKYVDKMFSDIRKQQVDIIKKDVLPNLVNLLLKNKSDKEIAFNTQLYYYIRSSRKDTNTFTQDPEPLKCIENLGKQSAKYKRELLSRLQARYSGIDDIIGFLKLVYVSFSKYYISSISQQDLIKKFKGSTPPKPVVNEPPVVDEPQQPLNENITTQPQPVLDELPPLNENITTQPQPVVNEVEDKPEHERVLEEADKVIAQAKQVMTNNTPRQTRKRNAKRGGRKTRKSRK